MSGSIYTQLVALPLPLMSVNNSFCSTHNVHVYYSVVPMINLASCPAHTCLPARNGLVNKVEFLGLITQTWYVMTNEIARLVIIT